jgi:UDP-glucose 4-epimerase
MKILVTGGAGFIGRWVVKQLLEKSEHQVLAFDDLSNGRRENVREFENKPNFLGLIEGDIKDRGLLKKIFAENVWDKVFHLGASINVQDSIDRPEITFQNDVVGTFAVLEACREQFLRLNRLDINAPQFLLNEVEAELIDRRPRIVCMSTCMVFSLASGDEGIDENHPLRPASPYAASKIAADNLALSYFHAYKMPVTVVRPFNTYGPYQKSNSEGGVVSIFLKRDLNNEPLLVKGEGTQTRDLLFVRDCADFVIRASEVERAEGHVINAGTGRDVSINALAEAIVSPTNEIRHVAHDHPQAEIPKLLCNPAKAKEVLGWQPRTSLEQGLQETRAWLAENKWAW